MPVVVVVDVVVVGAVVVVVVVGVGGDVVADHDRHRASFLLVVPAAGLCLSTRPFWLLVVTACGCDGRREAGAPSVRSAGAGLLPTTLGTLTVVGALATTRSIVEPGFDRGPAPGALADHGSGRAVVESGRW